MKRLALLAALCALGMTGYATLPAFNFNLKQLVWTVLYAGPQVANDPLPTGIDEGGGSAENYCQATLNSNGTAGSISFVGSLDHTANSFGLTVMGVPPNPASWGMFTYGLVQTNIPFANGYLCISPFSPGISKMPTQPLGNGTVTLLRSQHPAEFIPFTPGSTWYYQFWYRDPAA